MEIQDFFRLLIVIVSLAVAVYISYQNRNWYNSLKKISLQPSNITLLIAGIIVTGIFLYTWISGTGHFEILKYDTSFFISIILNLGWIFMLMEYRNIKISNYILMATIIFGWVNIFVICYKPVYLSPIISIMIYTSALSCIYVMNRNLSI